MTAVDFTKPRVANDANGTVRAVPREEDGTPYSEYKRTEPKPAFKLWSPEQIWAPLPPPDYLVGGLCVRGTLALLVAYGASLKTWVLIDGALAVATGGKWLDRFETTKGGALVIDFESGDWELRRRAHRLAAGRQLVTPLEGFAFVTMPTMSLADDDFYEALEPLAREHAFIGIDSLAAGSGGIDENDARFARSLQRLKALASETGSVVVLLHHARKSSASDKEKDSDPREMVRGTSAIFNACDVVLQLKRADDESFVCSQTKSRGGPKVDPFVVRVDDVGEGGSVVTSSDVGDDGEAEAAAADAFGVVKAKVVRLLAREHDVRSATEIYRRTKGTKKTVLEAVKELEERGTIIKHEGAYRLASEVRQ